MLPKITRSTRRVIALLLLTPAIVLLLGLLYMLGMTYLEGQPRTYLRSVMWASETLTTTGYGSDNQWTHPAMALLIITTQFLGQALSILILPVLLLPYFEKQFEARLPHMLPKNMEGVVMFYRFSPAIESVLDEFINTNSPFVIFEEDMVLARSLRDKGCNVVFGKLGNDPTAFASVRDARAVVCNGDDHSNATCTLIVREMGFKGSLFSLTDNPVYRTPKECTCWAQKWVWRNFGCGRVAHWQVSVCAIWNCGINTVFPSSVNGWAGCSPPARGAIRRWKRARFWW